MRVVFDTILDVKLQILYSGKAAVISSHRLNFIGNIDIQNRDRNLILFQKLLNEIVKKWPDVEFISSDELGKNIVSKYDKE